MTVVDHRAGGQVVFLAGGLATRLQERGRDLPKALQMVGGVPLVDRLIEVARGAGIAAFHFALGHLHQPLVQHLRERGVDFTYSLDDLEGGSGSAGALRAAAPYLDERFTVWLADTLPVDPPSGWFTHPRPPYLASMVVSSAVPDVTPNVAVADGSVMAYAKNGATGARYVDAGMYLLCRDVLDHVPAGRSDLERLWPALAAAGVLAAQPCGSTFLDIGTPDRLDYAERVLRERVGGAVHV